MKREAHLLSENEFDLVIIGGGITGACLAWDAVNRGLTVALVEKNDFGAATSSASSKLLHGGIRYLQQGRVDKVRESASERVYYQRIAPHLGKYVPFVVPAYKSLAKSKLILWVGMTLYQLICLGQNRWIRDKTKKVPGWKMLSKEHLGKYLPNVDLTEITGGALFYESHMQSSERMTLAFIKSAAMKGARVANHINVDAFIRNENTVTGVETTDLLTGRQISIKGACVVNAAGPWIPLLNTVLSNTAIVTAFSKGAHIVTTPITENTAIALTTKKQNQAIINRGGRHVFIIPWRGHSLIGTTYDAYEGALDDVCSTEDDIQELISDINSALGKKILARDDVKYSYAGIYPLIDNKINTRVYQGTGEYQIIDHAKNENLDGLVTVFGAKFTTARLLAEKALNKIHHKFNKSPQACITRSTPLLCGNIDDLERYRASKIIEYNDSIDDSLIDHLITYYGTDIDEIIGYLKKDKGLGAKLSDVYPDIEAQIVYAVEHEMACHLDDVLFRRTGLGTLGNPGTNVINRCADIMSDLMHWGEAQRQTEIQRVLDYYNYQ